MSGIILPQPDNFRGKYGRLVTSDVYDVAQRLWDLGQQNGTRLYISELDPPVTGFGKTYNFVISEWPYNSQEEMFVMRVEQLDARAVTACERMIHIPLQKRMAELEKVEAKWAEEEKERQLDELYEKMGGNMLIQLDRCGFVDRPVSYAKVNKTAQRHRRSKYFKGLAV